MCGQKQHLKIDQIWVLTIEDDPNVLIPPSVTTQVQQHFRATLSYTFKGQRYKVRAGASFMTPSYVQKQAYANYSQLLVFIKKTNLPGKFTKSTATLTLEMWRNGKLRHQRQKNETKDILRNGRYLGKFIHYRSHKLLYLKVICKN